jgi:hypothetical protein
MTFLFIFFIKVVYSMQYIIINFFYKLPEQKICTYDQIIWTDENELTE